MSDLQLWDGLIGALIGAVVGAVPAVLALRSSRAAIRQTDQANKTAAAALDEAKKANEATAAANEISTAALAEARQANEIAERAVEEARLARKIQHADWHRQAVPEIVLEKGERHKDTDGYALIFRCNSDIDSGSITLVPGYDRKAISGLGASPDEEVFNYGDSVKLPALPAGTTAVKGIWLDNTRAHNVSLRCEVTIGDDTWPVIRTLEFEGPFRMG